jgi:histidine triad (HIT) family protein
MSDPDCLFCKIVAGEIPSTRVYEDERTIAFMDINPGTRGHLLVIPREHSKNLLEIDAADLAACARTAQLLALRVSDRL